MKKVITWILIPIVTLIVLFLLIWVGLLAARFIVYHEYISRGEAVSKIPGLHDGFVPQGLTHVKDEIYIHSGYNGKVAELYYVDGTASKHLIPTDESGKVWEGHGGGVAYAGDFVYMANDEKIIVFSYSDLQRAKDGEQVKCIDVMPVDTAASFCFSDGNYLFVGEFYIAEKYEIDLSHAFTTPAGDEHRALVSCYPLTENGAIADPYPLYSISIDERVQGFAVCNDTYILSRSWALNSSTLEFYTGLLDSGTTIDVSGKSVPCTISTPPIIKAP